ncbi:hypothetical protein ACH4E7_44380 [Kitasatospora sp. NPDC018058]|uniref:hypothetical protein n=1 Tax=Kitasatospora sp. NPDC018058 TaxID=3364025 RepID=UPI0037C09038
MADFVVLRSAGAGWDGVESTDARFVDPVGQVRQLSWGQAAREVGLESCSPVRTFVGGG